MTTSAEILATARERARANAVPYEGLLLPSEAAQLMREEANAVLVDVRSRAEWDFVGRIPGAVEIEWKSYPGMLPNAQFQEQLAGRVKKEALVMFICTFLASAMLFTIALRMKRPIQDLAPADTRVAAEA